MGDIDNKVLCKHCGERIDADESFCPVCGAVNRKSFREDPDKDYCVFCGSELGTSEAFCKVCGTATRRILSAGDQGKKPESDFPRSGDDSVGLPGETDGGEPDVTDQEPEESDSDGQMNFLRKAVMKQRQDAEKEENYLRQQREEARVLLEEEEKLRLSAARMTQGYAADGKPGRGSASDDRATKVYSGRAKTGVKNASDDQATQIYITNGRTDIKTAADDRATQVFDVNDSVGKMKSSEKPRTDTAGGKENPEETKRLKNKAKEAGVSVEEIRLFEQAKASFESENETYPEDYNVNDYAQFDYSKSRYGSFNLGSLEREAMEYQSRQQEELERQQIQSSRKSSSQGVIGGTKNKKTPLGTRILVFFIAVFAVFGLAGILMYIMPMMKNVHPEEMLLDESVDTVELTITPISVATATPTPSPLPTSKQTSEPAVDAITPRPVAPSGESSVPTAGADIDVPDSGYLVPDSTTRIMDPSELDGLSAEKVRLIKYEIYARYGYTFRNKKYAEYFSRFDWYDPTIPGGEFPDEILSEEAQANLNMISEYEAQHGY